MGKDDERLQPEYLKIDPRKSRRELELDERVASLERAYLKAFEKKWGSKPVTTREDRDALRVVAVKYAGASQALIEGYLDLDDDWLEGQGFPLKYLPSRINRIAIVKGDSSGTKYVIGYSSESFTPVLDCDPRRLLNTPYYFVPVDVGTWERLTGLNSHLSIFDSSQHDTQALSPQQKRDIKRKVARAHSTQEYLEK